jgi:hypothetical protein
VFLQIILALRIIPISGQSWSRFRRSQARIPSCVDDWLKLSKRASLEEITTHDLITVEFLGSGSKVTKEQFLHNFSRLLISQDRHEIFIGFATYNPDFYEYLRRNKVTPDAFLKVVTYGPWSIENSRHMEQLSQVIVAIKLIAEDVA